MKSYNTKAAIVPNIISGILKCKNVGTQVSQMWSCWPSTFNPDVGPRVLSEAGEPASPNAPAVPTSAIIAAGLKPNAEANGTYIVAIIGIVPKEVPIPIVTISPIKSIIIAPINLLPPIKPVAASTKVSTPPVSLKTAP